MLLAALGMVLLAFLLGPYVLHGLRFPLGPDAPVYLWWTRLAEHDGLSAAQRPGVPALALVLQGLGLRPTAVLAALECVLAVSVGTGAAALVRGLAPRPRAGWLLAGLLTGTFAVHLAAGYLANLAFSALFLAAAVALAGQDRRRTAGAALLLAAAGFAHPLFFPLGALILVIQAALAWRADRAESIRTLGATIGAGALLGAGLLALQAGPGPLAVDTSRDGFLRRAGLTDVLRSAYLDRFVHRWARYVEWASVPLAVAGLRDARGFAGRFLRAWGLTFLGGVAFSLATGRFPADRFITFGYVVPILAAIGLVRLWRALERRRALALIATAALTLAMVAGAWIAWDRQSPFLSEVEVERATTAAAYASATAPGTTLVFTVNGPGTTLGFLATRAANVVRASMPPDRIRDVVVLVPPPTSRATTERVKLAQLTRDDVRAAERAGNGRAVTFVLAPFDRVDRPPSTIPVSEGVFVSAPTFRPRPIADPLLPTSPWGIALAAVVVLAALSAVGSGWAGLVAGERAASLALAPAVGAGATILLAIALERAGLPLEGHVGPATVLVVALASGHLVRWILERRARANPAE